MIHEKIELHVPGSADYAAMYTYFLDLSKEVPIETVSYTHLRAHET